MTEAKTPTGHIAYCIAAKRIQCSTFQKKVLWLYYAINTNNEGRFFKSYDTITAETGVSESTARRCNRDWEKLKLITTVEPALDSGKATEYQLHLPAMQALAAKFNVPVRRNGETLTQWPTKPSKKSYGRPSGSEVPITVNRNAVTVNRNAVTVKNNAGERYV
jgi:hypothetical protein